MKMLRSVGFACMREARPKFFISRRTGKERLTQGSQVKAGATHQENALMARFDLFNLFRGGARPIRSREIDLRRNEIYQVVGNAIAFWQWNLRGRDLDLLIDLNRVAVDDLSTQTQGQLDSQRALAGSGRADNRNNAGSADILSAVSRGSFGSAGHPREMISRIAITSQMTTSSRIAPVICARDKRMRKTVTETHLASEYLPLANVYFFTALARRTLPSLSSFVPVVVTLAS